MSIWKQYPEQQREEYIKFLKSYGALSKLFRQKKENLIPHLDPKFQETVYAMVFKSENVDISNTPHDILSIFGENRIGIGLKTWMNSKASYQKVMQLKQYKDEINEFNNQGDKEELAHKISSIKNERLLQDYNRLNLTKTENIYHYITRDENKFIIQESSYPLVDLDNLNNFKLNNKSFFWSDGLKEYKYTFGDSQIFMKFDSANDDTIILEQFNVKIINNPFDFLLDSYDTLTKLKPLSKKQIEVAYLPFYSYRSKKVEIKSGLNSWNSESKNKGSDTPRPDREIYIPIPIEFHRKNPNFFTNDMMENIKQRELIKKYNKENQNQKIPYSDVKFTIVLPSKKEIAGRITQDGMKGFQSGGELKGVKYGQSDLGNWLLNEVLDLKVGDIVTKEWLEKKGTDSLKIWHEKGNKNKIYIDFAPLGAFEKYMNDEEV